MIRVGFLGAGFISNLHRLFLDMSDVDHGIAAVHDPDAARAAQFATATGAQVVGEEELLDLVDAVYIATWTSEHPRLVRAAAEAGKAIFCEKPLATNLADVEAMVAAVEKTGVVNQVGLVLRFLPPFRLVRRLLADERAGSVLAVVFRDDQYLPVQGQYGSTWRVDPERCGRGTMLEHSIHDVDILRWWLGPVTALSASTRSYHGHPGIEDVAAVRLDFASGATATLTSVWHDMLERQSQRNIEIFCERLYVRVEDDFAGPVTWQFAGKEAQVAQGADLAEEVLADDDRGNPARAFLTAVAEKRPAWPGFSDALPAHQVVDAVYRSADAGGELVRDVER
jgi:predicted dehydrogenase